MPNTRRRAVRRVVAVLRKRTVHVALATAVAAAPLVAHAPAPEAKTMSVSTLSAHPVAMTTPIWENVPVHFGRAILPSDTPGLPTFANPAGPNQTWGVTGPEYKAADLDPALLEAIAGAYNGSSVQSIVIHPERIIRCWFFYDINMPTDSWERMVQVETADDQDVPWGVSMWVGTPTVPDPAAS